MKSVNKGLESKNEKYRHISLKSQHMKTLSKKLILDLKVSTHDFKESTHDFKESTHVDNGHMELKCRCMTLRF